MVPSHVSHGGAVAVVETSVNDVKDGLITRGGQRTERRLLSTPLVARRTKPRRGPKTAVGSSLLSQNSPAAIVCSAVGVPDTRPSIPIGRHEKPSRDAFRRSLAGTSPITPAPFRRWAPQIVAPVDYASPPAHPSVLPAASSTSKKRNSPRPGAPIPIYDRRIRGDSPTDLPSPTRCEPRPGPGLRVNGRVHQWVELRQRARRTINGLYKTELIKPHGP